jgi:hypothetical protein
VLKIYKTLGKRLSRVGRKADLLALDSLKSNKFNTRGVEISFFNAPLIIGLNLSNMFCRDTASIVDCYFLNPATTQVILDYTISTNFLYPSFAGP